MTDETERSATPLCQSIELALTNQPDVKYKYGSGRIRPQHVVFYYLDGRINVHLYGVWVREDGELTDAPVDQDYRHDADWPDWLAEMARKHDPRTKDARHKAGLRRADQINNELMEEVQRYAAGTERPVLWSVYNRMHLRALDAEHKAERLSADRAAVLLEAADVLDTLPANASSFDEAEHKCKGGAAAETLRRMADESAPAVVGRAENETQDQAADYERTTGHTITCLAVAGGGSDPDCPCTATRAAGAQQPKETRP